MAYWKCLYKPSFGEETITSTQAILEAFDWTLLPDNVQSIEPFNKEISDWVNDAKFVMRVRYYWDGLTIDKCIRTNGFYELPNQIESGSFIISAEFVASTITMFV